MKYVKDFWELVVWLVNGWKANAIYEDKEDQPEPDIEESTLKISKTVLPDTQLAFNEWGYSINQQLSNR